MPHSNFPFSLLSLIQSTSYPPLPPREDLDSIKQVLSDQRTAPNPKRKREESIPIVPTPPVDRVRKASPVNVKVERSVSPAGSVISAIAPASSVNRVASGGAPITYSGIKKKKKRLESEDDVRSIASPPAPGHHTTSTSGLTLKLNKSRPHIDPSPTPTTSYPPITTSYGAHIDFSLPPPPSRPLVPPRPGVAKPPQPGPKRQADVNEDFSNTKAPTQTAQPTFWTSVEPYLREIREDDLAMLNFKADAPESYDIPARGRHYTEIWDEEDGMPIGTTPRYPVPGMRHAMFPHGHGHGHFTPATELREEHLVDEHRGLGSLTERIVAGIVTNPASVQTTDGGDLYEGNRELARVDVVDMEEKMKRELRGAMLLGDQEEYTPQNRDDDEITSALRQCQRLLLEQTQINDARKSRLANIAQHRLAYSEYSQSLDGIEKSIETAWVKRVKKYGATPKKSSTEGTPAPGSGRPPVPENVMKLVNVRRSWVDTVGKTMAARPKGEVVGIPEASIYEGLGEDVDERVVEESIELELDEEA